MYLLKKPKIWQSAEISRGFWLHSGLASTPRGSFHFKLLIVYISYVKSVSPDGIFIMYILYLDKLQFPPSLPPFVLSHFPNMPFLL